MAGVPTMRDVVYTDSWNEYDVDADGNIITIPRSATVQEPASQRAASQAARQAASQQALVNAQLKSQTIKQQKSLEAQQAKYDEELSRNRQLNTLAEQIAALAGTSKQTDQAQLGAASNLMYSGGNPNFNEATGTYNTPIALQQATQQPVQSGKLSPFDFISSSEIRETNQLVKDATKRENGTSKVSGISPSAEIPPKGVGQYLIIGGISGKKILNPDYDPKITKEWQDKRRSELYNELSKYIGADAANSVKTKYDQLYSVSDLQSDPNLRNKLNFQVSDQQILNDYNASKISKLTEINQNAQTQKVGILNRLSTARDLLSQLPESDARYKSSKVYVDQLESDLASVDSAIADSFSQIKGFKPITAGSPEAASQITSFREYLQLPEEKATQQLRQIDPESYRTAVALGQRYRQMATQPLGPTTTPQTEQLRSQLEQEAINQLALGSQLGAEEQRQYQQAARAAQTARGNIFGVAPAVEEAVTTGAAGEQRKLARYGAASQFLASGESTGAALARDIALRDALTQQRLGAASGFIAGGPTLYNLGQARTAQQQQAMQAYVQANQPLPGQFAQAQSTAQPFYQVTQPQTAVDLTNTFANLYGSMANYQASTYGNYVGALSRQPTGAQQFGAILGGISGLVPSFSFSR